MVSERERTVLNEVSKFEERLWRRPNDLAIFLVLKAFCQLFTAGCLEIRSEYRPPLYRLAEGIDLELLGPEERIMAECAGSFHGECLEELLLKAKRRIHEVNPNSIRKITTREAGILEELRAEAAEALRTTISEALAYEPPVSSCSV